MEKPAEYNKEDYGPVSDQEGMVRVSRRTRSKTSITLLRMFGVYGSYNLVKFLNQEWSSQVRVGFELPSWLSMASLTLELKFSTLCGLGV